MRARLLVVLLWTVWSAPAQTARAQEPDSQAAPSAEPAVSRMSEAETHGHEGFWRRYRSTHLAFELDAYGGLHMLPKNHDLQDRKVVTTAAEHEPLKDGGEAGL